MQCTNPTTEEIYEVEEFPVDKIKDAISALKKAASEWRYVPLAARISKLQKLPQIFESRRSEIVSEIGKQMGKPKTVAEVELDRSLEEMRFLLDHAGEWIATKKVTEGYVQYDALGVASVISPWNFPILLPMRAIFPALIAGNGVIFKPSELTPLLGRTIAELIWSLGEEFKRLFIPVIGGKDHGKAIVEADVDVIAFTGSTTAGKQIARVASEKLKRVVLELGGLDAAIIMKDVEVKAAALGVIKANTANSGQVCNALKRAYVEAPIFDRFVEECVKVVEGLQLGAPETDPDLGPLVSKVQLERVEKFVEDARTKGAKVLCGGKRREGKGYFYIPTLLTNVNEKMLVLQEEPFGPVLPIIPIASWKEGVEKANDTRYGLTASVWSGDTELAKEIATRLDVGTVSFNSHKAGGAGTPWGGAKESGIGRMKTKEGLRDFTNTKLVRW